MLSRLLIMEEIQWSIFDLVKLTQLICFFHLQTGEKLGFFYYIIKFLVLELSDNNFFVIRFLNKCYK